jgi:hypothetical protein
MVLLPGRFANPFAGPLSGGQGKNITADHTETAEDENPRFQSREARDQIPNKYQTPKFKRDGHVSELRI